MTTTARQGYRPVYVNGPLMARAVRTAPERSNAPVGITAVTWTGAGERVKGIEPSLSAWEADVLPLNYTRKRPPLYLVTQPQDHERTNPPAALADLPQ